MSTAPALTASGIVKRYGKRVVLDGAGLILRRGEVVAVVGENGSGKSSLLRICAGLLAADAGTVERRGRVGYCPQQPALFELLTAREHLVLFGRAIGLDRASALRQGSALMAEFGFRGSDDTVVKAMSGGTRQKLNLTLALLGNPQVLLLDEPYQGFDHGTYVDFWAHVSRWRDQKVAVAVVTHMLTELWRADQVVQLTCHRALSEVA
ncbi:MAG: ABC transporter ATP-binding protein [Actinomycetota bacterium]|nr:ABC transporter ATP-binding protein [Actinomycetota bacterium]